MAMTQIFPFARKVMNWVKMQTIKQAIIPVLRCEGAPGVSESPTNNAPKEI